MFNRVFLLLFLFIVAVGTASLVSAGDVSDDAVGDTGLDEMGVNDDDIMEEAVGEDASNELSAANEEENVIGASTDEDVLQDYNGRQISELQNLIDKTSSGGTISLKFDYYCDSTTNNGGITIDRPITINGNGHTIDANKYSRIFYITGNNVVLNNLTFRNAHSYEYGGCIYSEGLLTINDCNFYDNSAEYSGGAIAATSGLTLNNCIFRYNEVYGQESKVDYSPTPVTLYGFGGAIYMFAPTDGDKYLNITDTTFANNNARAGGAVYLDFSTRNFGTGGYSIICYMKNAGFYYNNALFGGGALYGHQYFDIADSGFVGNYAGGSGGAICLENSYGIVDYQYTVLPTYLFVHGESAFAYNVAQYSGGAILFGSSEGKGGILIYDNVIFDGNNATTAAAMSVNDIESLIIDATFVNNIADNNGALYGGTAVDCSFSGNSNPQYYNTTILTGTALTVKQTGTTCDNKVITATLTVAKGGAPIANQYVSFYINGKTTKVKTDSNGKATLNVNLPAKTYSATVSFPINSKYFAASKDVSVVVKKATPKITASKATFKAKTKTKKYTVTLKNSKGKVMKSTKVKLTVKGKTFTATTNSKGKATFKITNLKTKGSFTATVKYAGSKYYYAVNKKVKLTVKK